MSTFRHCFSHINSHWTEHINIFFSSGIYFNILFYLSIIRHFFLLQCILFFNLIIFVVKSKVIFKIKCTANYISWNEHAVKGSNPHSLRNFLFLNLTTLEELTFLAHDTLGSWVPLHFWKKKQEKILKYIQRYFGQ